MYFKSKHRFQISFAISNFCIHEAFGNQILKFLLQYLLVIEQNKPYLNLIMLNYF